jgi:hypothetical protein
LVPDRPIALVPFFCLSLSLCTGMLLSSSSPTTPTKNISFPLYTGAGAWCEWSYQVRVSPDNRSYTNITGTEFTLEGLRPSTSYSVQVLAYSGGRGPLSPPNRGKTLRETAYNITLLWGSSNGGLYATDTLGEDLHLLTTTGGGVGGGAKEGQLFMQSLTWFESTVFFALSNGSVFYYV